MGSMGRIFHALAAACAAAALTCGCQGPKALESNPVVSVVEGNTLPPPTRTDLTIAGRSYVIGPYDKLKISVFGIEELREIEIQTDGSGMVSFPLAGEITAAGRTPGEVADEIENRLRGQYVRDPQVTVNLEETVSQVVAVDGQVIEPGLYPVVGRMTLMKAVADAKGTTEFARQDDVVIFRTVDGTSMAALYNLAAIRQGAYPDPEVYANDVVVVGTSRARRIFRDVLSGAPLITTPIIAVLTNNTN